MPYCRLGVWIGYQTSGGIEDWKWMDGSVSKYTNWLSDQPNGYFGDTSDSQGYCVGLWSSFKWFDTLCNLEKHPYICEAKSPTTPPPQDEAVTEVPGKVLKKNLYAWTNRL